MTRQSNPSPVLLAALLGVTMLAVSCGRSPAGATPPPPTPDYAPPLRRLLEAKLALLRDLAQASIIQDAVAAANHAHASLTAAQIARQDARWCRADADDPFWRELQGNPAARWLAEFCSAQSGFSEVFVTDRQGLVVAMSNRTSDYLQSDEAWWQESFAGGRGHASVGRIEYDESARSQAIALYVPVPSAPGRPVAGVIKALYAVDAIKAEL